MTSKQKLELTWIGKDKTIKVEPRILIHDETKDYGDKNTGNMLIYGDNLLALKALEQEYAGKVKCIYIDPPYNTGSRIDADGNEVGYDDNLEHSTWCNMMYPRIQLFKKLLMDDGLLAIQIDDTEFAYLYMLVAEIFGRDNIKIICVKMSEPTGVKMASVKKVGSIPKLKEFIILAKPNGIKNLELEYVPKEKWDREYKTVCLNVTKENLNFIKDILENEQRNEQDIKQVAKLAQCMKFSPVQDVCKEESGLEVSDEWLYNNAWRITQIVTLTGGARDIAKQIKKEKNILQGAFPIVTPNNKMYLIKGDFNVNTDLPRCKVLFADKYLTTSPGDFWQDIKTTGLDNEGTVKFKNGKKPEALIKRIIKMATKKGDLVLDSFLGSGTTAAVAHKMGRKYIGIELGEHCHTHCIPRLQKVIDGTDQGGISKAVGWKGGGGFKYYYLAPSLLDKDKYGQYVISKEYNADMLAAAMAKHEGFLYAPDQDQFWKQGKSSEQDYIYTTTSHVGEQALSAISADMKDGESLLICCKSFDKGLEGVFPNISIKKIPAAILGRCEFGKDNYNLNIINPTAVEEEEE